MATIVTTYNNKIQGYQGNSKDLVCIVYDASNNLYDLTGFSAYLYGKKYPVSDNATLDISINSSSIDPSNGAILFNLSSSDLDLTEGDYVYEIVIDNGAGIVKTVVQDRFNLLKSIS
jgi:hypothetical protein